MTFLLSSIGKRLLSAVVVAVFGAVFLLSTVFVSGTILISGATESWADDVYNEIILTQQTNTYSDPYNMGCSNPFYNPVTDKYVCPYRFPFDLNRYLD